MEGKEGKGKICNKLEGAGESKQRRKCPVFDEVRGLYTHLEKQAYPYFVTVGGL